MSVTTQASLTVPSSETMRKDINPISSPSLSGCLCALTATVLWSGNFIVARVLAGQLSPVETAFWRWLLSFLMVLPFAWRSAWEHRDSIRRNAVSLLLMGFLGVSLINTLNYKAGLTTEATNIALAATSAPVFMAIITRVFLRETLSGWQVAGLATAFVGVGVLITKGSLARLLALSFSEGDLWALAGAVLFAVYSIQVRFRPKDLPQFAFLAVIFGVGTLGLLPCMLWETVVAGTASWPSLPQWGSLLYISLGASVLGFTFWNMAIDRVGPVRSGVLYYSIPLFSSVEAALLLGEGVTAPQICGGALIIGGILFSSFVSSRQHCR